MPYAAVHLAGLIAAGLLCRLRTHAALALRRETFGKTDQLLLVKPTQASCILLQICTAGVPSLSYRAERQLQGCAQPRSFWNFDTGLAGLCPRVALRQKLVPNPPCGCVGLTCRAQPLLSMLPGNPHGCNTQANLRTVPSVGVICSSVRPGKPIFAGVRDCSGMLISPMTDPAILPNLSKVIILISSTF